MVAYWPLVFIVVFQLRWAAGTPEGVGNHGDSHQDHLYHPLSVSPSIALVQITIREMIQVPVHQSYQTDSQLLSIGSKVEWIMNKSIIRPSTVQSINANTVITPHVSWLLSCGLTRLNRILDICLTHFRCLEWKLWILFLCQSKMSDVLLSWYYHDNDNTIWEINFKTAPDLFCLKQFKAILK